MTHSEEEVQQLTKQFDEVMTLDQYSIDEIDADNLTKDFKPSF